MSLTNQHIKLTVLLICILIAATYQQEPTAQSINIGDTYNITQQPYTLQYFQLTYNISQQLLMITIDQSDDSYLAVYISTHLNNSNKTYYTRPNDTHNTRECDQRSFDTCVIRFEDGNVGQLVTVYFSIYPYEKVMYSLIAVEQDIFKAKITSKYRIDFTQFETGLMQISGDQFIGIEELVMILSYNTTGLVGKFKVMAEVDNIPNTDSTYALHGTSVGAFNKILKLPPIDKNQSYFILLQGEKGTLFTVHFFESTPSAPSIGMNSSLIYQTNNNLTYMAHTIFQNIDLPLYIRFYAFSGYGIFKLNYCNGLIQTTFQNLNGQNGEIGITPKQRAACQQRMKNTSFGLLIQNIQIKIDNVVYSFGYQIQINEGIYPLVLRYNQQKYGLFLSSQNNRTYPIELYIRDSDLFVIYKQVTDNSGSNLLFQIEECEQKKSRQKCKVIAGSLGEASGSLLFNPKIDYTYNVKITFPNVTAQPDKLQFMIGLMGEYQISRNIVPSKLYLQQIEENQYKFYQINLTKIADQQKININNLSELSINLKQINGEVILLSSLTTPKPTYEDYLDQSSDVKFAWNGKTTYIVNQTTEMLYIGVKGYQEALYYLQYTIDVDADLPMKYTKLADDTQNNFILNSNNTHQLLTFSSHIIPYKIFITGNPKCIKLGYTLPLNQTCLTELPKQFTDKVVYLNITNGDKPSGQFKFSVYINSGDYILSNKDPLLVGCGSTCYEIVTIELQDSSKVIHQGRGSISEIGNTSNIATNTFLQLSCKQYPCYVKINATLPYGGEMNLFLQSSGIQEVDWTSIPITFGTNIKKCIFPLRSWSDINSILIYAQALQLDVYYSVIDIHQQKTNIITYDFPTPTKFEGKSPGNPLRNVHVVQIDNDLIKKKGCRGALSFCVVALSLYPNLQVEYNQNYLNGGIGFISSNTYQYFLPFNIPYEVQQKFSMSYFTHKKSSKETASLIYKVNIEPLSNCHPKLYTGLYYDNPTFQIPTYDDAVVNYNNGWINFTVLAEKACRYTVSLTNSNLEMISQNKYYNLQVSNKIVTFLFRSQYANTLGFTIDIIANSIFDKIEYILVSKVTDSQNMTVPSIVNNHFMAMNKSSLFVNQTQFYGLYTISVMTNSQNINLIVRKDASIILTHNQEHTQIIKTGAIMSYAIYTTGSIALFLTTNAGYPTITVNKLFNTTKVLQTFINSKSSPWINITASSNELTQYDLTINNDGTEDITITILYQSNDVISYKRLYEGIIAYDAFVTKNQINCYYFSTPLLVGRKDIVVDFVINKLQNQKCQDCEVTLLYRAYTSSNVIDSNIKHLKSAASTFRLELQFVPNQNYTICFHSPNMSALNRQYYVLINDPQMQHLVEDYTLTQNNQNSYDMYEIVEEGVNQNIMIQLTTCNPTATNQKLLVGSSSFVDSQMGRFTDLLDYHKNRDSIFAKLSVAEGYYYLGVKNLIYLNEYLNAYTVRFQDMGNDDKLLANTWALKSNKIVKIYKDHQNMSQYLIQMPEIVNVNKNIVQENIKITYTVYLLNLNQNTDASRIPLNILARCPDYHQQKLYQNTRKKDTSNQKPINKSATFYYDNLQQYQQKFTTPFIIFDRSQIPTKFNITGRIDVESNSQKFSYYYDTIFTEVDPRSEEESQGMTGLLVTIVAICAILLIGMAGYLLITKKKKEEQKKKVAFQLANFNHAQGDSTARKQQNEPFTTPTKSKPEKGYGELVDEIN